MYRKRYNIFFLCFLSLHAKDLGSYGESFEIQEENLLTIIQRKLQTLEQNGGIAKHQQELARKATDKI